MATATITIIHADDPSAEKTHRVRAGTNASIRDIVSQIGEDPSRITEVFRGVVEGSADDTLADGDDVEVTLGRAQAKAGAR